MIESRFINVIRAELNTFSSLDKIIRENSLEKLAVSFIMMSIDGDAYDEAVSQKKRIILKESNTLLKKTSKDKIDPVLRHCNVDASHWRIVQEVKNHWDEYRIVYRMLADDLSRETFLRVLLSRFLLDPYKYMTPINKPISYFDFDMLTKRDSAVFVDCGAFTGDTVQSFCDHYSSGYKMIYAYEPSLNYYKQAVKTIKARDVVWRNCGVGECADTLSFYVSQNFNAGDRIDYDFGKGNTSVPVVTLDEDITIPVTFIKMDIEGSELFALKGAKNHIIDDKPQLAICVYHLLNDLRTIPKLIHSYNPNQKYYLRHHGNYLCADFVFYADPVL